MGVVAQAFRPASHAGLKPCATTALLLVLAGATPVSAQDPVHWSAHAAATIVRPGATFDVTVRARIDD